MIYRDNNHDRMSRCMVRDMFMVILSMHRNGKNFLIASIDINHDKMANFDINLDIVSKLMDNLMVIVSMRRKQGNVINHYLDINLDTVSRFKRDLREF